uniref:Uncharacterized protein n=1 Tax=Micrurus lemniscatus lemniscatus TaxID=129467 RepID=A0A2D4IVR4_MICLE
MMTELNLIDIWRKLNPEKRQFTFYSNPHQLWTQIDMAWMNGEIANKLKEIKILTNEWADHNLIQLLWRGRKKPKKWWTLNTLLIKEKEFTNRLREELNYFLKENNSEATTKQNIWDTMKAVIRSITMLYTTKRNKEKYAQQNRLQQRIRELEIQLQSTPKDLRLQNQMTVTKHKLNLIKQEGMTAKLNITI